MTNHPNRTRRANAPGFRPSAAQVRQLRLDREMTVEDWAAWLYVAPATAYAWESGERRMPALTWEFANLMQAYQQVEEYRRMWHEGRMEWT